MTFPRVTIFIAVALSVWTLMHLYVYMRVATVPCAVAHVPRRVLAVAMMALWACYPLGRILGARGMHWIARPFEFAGAIWLGALFLLLSALFAVDVVTLGGYLLPKIAPVARGWAALAACVLSVAAVTQGLRQPVVREYQIALRGLPPERDGLVLAVLSDLHLGSLIGERWIARLVGRVNAMHADAVLLVGDVVDGHVDHVEDLLHVLQELRAPLGVWAVTGNHEYYAGADRCVRLFEDAGYAVLRDRCAEVAPGLVFAGVDDLAARREMGIPIDPFSAMLSNRPRGAVVLLSHTPARIASAASAGAGLMLSGHTHNGQLWPFNFIVRLVYRYIGGMHMIDKMPLIICRGTGTWGPRMRLWRPSEFLRITLRSTP
ncbi:metallophosphoesterase [bacterium]|nr:metallophosphoesterase [bacterium]